MKVRRPEDCVEIVANDGCRLRELLHPDRGFAAGCFSLAVAEVSIGESTLPHRLVAETETYYVLSGSARIFVDGDSAFLRAGDVAVVPAGAEQWVTCAGDEPLRFLNIVDPPWNAENDVRSRRD